MPENTVNTEKYSGPSKFGSTVGGVLSSYVGSGILLSAFERITKKSLPDTFITTAVLLITAIGGYLGFKHAKAGKNQFDSLKVQLANQESRSDALLTQVEGLNQEVGAHRKSFAELHAKHKEQSASHAAKHESRAEHGSQAAAALHDKEKASTAELTV